MIQDIDSRMIEYGKVLLQGAKGTEPHGGEDEVIIGSVKWTAKEEDRAWQIHRLVVQLDPKTRIIVQTYYRAREAEHWYELTPDDQRKIQDELCREINARWRQYCATVPQLPVTVRWYQIPSILERARKIIAEGLVAKQQRAESTWAMCCPAST